MEIVKKIFSPLTHIKGRTMVMLVIIQTAVALLLWEIFGANGLIPTPSKIIKAVFSIITTEYFIDNFFSSLGLTLTGMGLSIVIALVVSYLSLIPVFTPLARFIVKCRYLTLT